MDASFGEHAKDRVSTQLESLGCGRMRVNINAAELNL